MAEAAEDFEIGETALVLLIVLGLGWLIFKGLGSLKDFLGFGELTTSSGTPVRDVMAQIATNAQAQGVSPVQLIDQLIADLRFQGYTDGQISDMIDLGVQLGAWGTGDARLAHQELGA